MYLAEAAFQDSKIEAMHDDAPFPTKPRLHDGRPTKRFPFQVFPKSVTTTIHTLNTNHYQPNQDFPFEDFPKFVAKNHTLSSLILLPV